MEVEVKINDLFLAVRYGCQARRYMEAFITYWRRPPEGITEVGPLLGRDRIRRHSCTGGFFPTERSDKKQRDRRHGSGLEPTESSWKPARPTRMRMESRGRTSRLSFPSRLDFNSGTWENMSEAIASLEAGKEKAVSLQRWEDAAENIRRHRGKPARDGPNYVEARKRIRKLLDMRLAGSETKRLGDFRRELAGSRRAERSRARQVLNDLSSSESSDHLHRDDSTVVINPPGYEQVDTRVLLGKILHQLGEWKRRRGLRGREEEWNCQTGFELPLRCLGILVTGTLISIIYHNCK